MKQYAFCEYCMKMQPYIVNDIHITTTLNDEEISYDGKKAICCQCRNEIFVNDICRENLETLYSEYRKKNDLIENDKISIILKKYDISEESLSIILGLSNDAVSRYLKGDMVSVHDSNVLKKIYKNIQYYSLMLETNKDKIKAYEYCRSRKAVKFMMTTGKVESKVDGVIKYILTRSDDVTLLMIQKLIYYVQAFYYVFTEHFLFDEDFKAGDRGPLLESVYERYKVYGFEYINNEILNNEEVNLLDIEKNIVEGVLKFYGCYSGKILEKMVENEAPWILARKKMLNCKSETHLEEQTDIISKDALSVYFTGVKDKYEMISVLDMEKYSKDIFEKISL